MGFPFSYKSDIGASIFAPEFVFPSRKAIIGSICRNLSGLSPESIDCKGKTISFTSNYSIFNSKYPVEIRVKSNTKYVLVSYEFQIGEIFNITLFIGLIAIFISTFLVKELFGISLLLTFIFFIVNVLYVNSAIRGAIMQIPEFNKNKAYILETEDTRKLKNLYSGKCLFCGDVITEYSFICPSCKSVNPFSENYPVDFSKYSNKQFRYLYKPLEINTKKEIRKK